MMASAVTSGSVRRAPQRFAIFGALGLLLMLIGGCSAPSLGVFSDSTPAAPPQAPAEATASVDTFGSGPVKVGAILPLTQNGAPSSIGQSLRNAAELAVEESGANAITLTVADDRSTPDGAAAAASAELAGGAEILVGPLFSASVRQVAAQAKAAGKPMIAFSTDASVASDGVYLLSFMVEGYVDRVMEYAANQGKKTFAIIAPQTDLGNVAVNEAQLQASALNVQLVTIARYPAGQPAGAVQQITSTTTPIDALLLAEQADSAGIVAAALDAKKFKGQILGTGLWNDPKALNASALKGAWFAAPENGGFNGFAQKYKAKFNSDPARLASLAYDAVSLVAALARAQNQNRFAASVLTNPSGFNGADGLFRFRANGVNERGLAVMQIGAGSANVISPAPKSFAGG